MRKSRQRWATDAVLSGLFVIPAQPRVCPAHTTGPQPLYAAITVSHDNMHPINRHDGISQPIHSSNGICLITT